MLLKSCRCGKLIPQSVKMCEECEQRQQSRHMIYNNTRRDKRAAEFYVSKEWRAMRERIIEVYDNVDIYALYVTLWDLGENDENFSDDDAEGVTLSVQVTIFSESDEVELAREIKSIMKENDFSFEGRNGDDSKPEDGIYMKAQRFSKFYEMEE